MTPPTRTPLLTRGFHLPAIACGLTLLILIACGGDAREEAARDEAGITSDPVALEDVLPDLGVTGPTDLPEITRADEAGKARFMAVLTNRCVPAYAEAGSFRAGFPGRTTVNTLSNPDPFEGVVLHMLLDDCDGDLLPIPFLVGADASRTWLLEFREEGLRLAHDHRDAEGTPGDANLYGGFAHLPSGDEPDGDETILYFPADEQTIEDRPARSANVWAMAVDSTGGRFFYRLYLNGVLRLEAVFDLTTVVPVEVSPDLEP